VAGEPLVVADDGGYAEAAAWADVPADTGPESSAMGAARGSRELSTGTDKDIAEAMQREEHRMLEEERYQKAEVTRRDAEPVRRMVAGEADTDEAEKPPHGPSEGLRADKKGKVKLAVDNPAVETTSRGRRWEHTVAEVGKGSMGPAAAAPSRGLEADAYVHAVVMACFAEGLPLVEPGRRQLVEGVPDWVENSNGTVQVATPHRLVRPLRVLLDGGSYYTLVGAKLKAQLRMEEADMDGGGQKVHTATGKVEPLQGGLTKQPVPIILNANTAEELTIYEHVAFTYLNGYDLLIGTRALYPSGL
jgi:hypothetical protein